LGYLVLKPSFSKDGFFVRVNDLYRLNNFCLKETTKAQLALLGTNLFFAINFTAIKYLINGGFAKPFAINIVRVGVSSILLWLLFFLKPVKTTVKRKDIGRFMLCALLGVAINQLLFVKGLSLTWSIHASLLMLSTPILITVIAAWLLKERLTGFKIMGLVAGIAGAIVLVSSREKTGNPTEVFWGDIMILLNAIAYTIYFILVKPLMKTYHPIAIIRVIFTIGFFMMLPFCWQEFREVNWQAYTPLAWINISVVVLLGTFLAYLFNVYGIKILGAAAAGNFIYSQPVFAVAIAVLFLGETISMVKLVAAILIFAGVYLTNKPASVTVSS
jgi:drug/metabolite transporter (DMT)-like permease